MLLLINYANEAYQKSQRLNSETGLQVAGFNRIISYGPKDIESSFYQKNQHILSQWRGNGYWLWKSYFIKKSLDQLNDGDFLFYCDSGAYFINTIDPIVNISQQTGQDVIPFGLQHIERIWTKRDAFILMDCDHSEYTDSKQRLASYSLWRKTPFALHFANTWLEYSQDIRLITDLQNQMGSPNYPDYREHRHDQSIFSLLTKKYKLEAYRDPSQLGNAVQCNYPNSRYDQLLELTRRRQILADLKNLLTLIRATPVLWKMIRNSMSS